LRFVHLADIHIGSTYRGKELFNWKRFEKVIKKIIELSPDFVLISGDLFDKPIINPEDFFKTYQYFKKLVKKEIPIFTIEGNHDYNNIHLTYYDILSKLGVINNLSSGDKIAFLKDKYESEFVNFKEIDLKGNKRYFAFAEINGKKILGMAYLRTKESINYFLPKYYKEGDILMLHQSVSKISGIPEDYCELKITDLTQLNFKYFALGHIHTTNFGNHLFNNKIIIYSGSIDMTSKKEFHKIIYDRELKIKKQKKGFLLYDNELNFIEIESQNFFDVTIFFNSLEELKNKIEKIKNIVKDNKIILTLNSDYSFNHEKIKNLLEDLDILELKFNFAEEETNETIEFKENNKIEEIINRFISFSKIAKNKEELKSRLLLLIEEIGEEENKINFNTEIIQKNIEKKLMPFKDEQEIKKNEVKKVLKKRNILDFLN
jgi:exonuclease SbcD